MQRSILHKMSEKYLIEQIQDAYGCGNHASPDEFESKDCMCHHNCESE